MEFFFLCKLGSRGLFIDGTFLCMPASSRGVANGDIHARLNSHIKHSHKHLQVFFRTELKRYK
jgi:hypothetical protein